MKPLLPPFVALALFTSAGCGPGPQIVASADALQPAPTTSASAAVSQSPSSSPVTPAPTASSTAAPPPSDPNTTTVAPTATTPVVAPPPKYAHSFSPGKEPPITDVAKWEIKTLLPRAHIAVPGTVTGVLWSAGLGDFPKPQEAGIYTFSFDREQGEGVSFVDPTGQNTIVGTGVGANGGDTDVIKSFRPGDKNNWQLSALAHLVEIEVSHGKGRAALPEGSMSSFVVSKMKILDGQVMGAPIADMIQWSTVNFKKVVQQKGQGKLLEPGARIDVLPTWLRDKNQLVVVLVLKALGPNPVPGVCAPCVRGNMNCPCSFEGVILAGEYAFDTQGHVASRTYYQPQKMTHSIIQGQIQ